MTQNEEETIEQLNRYLNLLRLYLPKLDHEKIIKLHEEISVWYVKGRNIDDLIKKVSIVEEPSSGARPALTAAIIGSRSYRSKVQDTSIGDVLRDTLNSVVSLGGRASADEVSKLTHRQSNLESSYLKELWEKRLLLTRQRDGRIVFYSTPERALVDALKQTDKLIIDNLMTLLSEYAPDHRIEKDTMVSIIESAKAKNIVKTEGDIISLV